jgi:DNA modification methylase
VGKNILYNGDCLIESDKIESGTVDLILTDLPYGNMNNAQTGGRKLGINWNNGILLLSQSKFMKLQTVF